jgi:predicted nucleic acid-binding protein
MSKPTAFVLDASVAMAWALPDEASAYSDLMLERLVAGKAWVPNLWPYELANGLLMAQKRSRITAAQRVAFVEQVLKLPIEVDHPSTRAVLETLALLAEQYGLTAYDAAYLDLALRKGTPLITQDKALMLAAERAGVEIAA